MCPTKIETPSLFSVEGRASPSSFPVRVKDPTLLSAFPGTPPAPARASLPVPGSPEFQQGGPRQQPRVPLFHTHSHICSLTHVHALAHTHYGLGNSSLIPVGCPTIQFNSDMTTRGEHRPHKLKGRSPKDCSHCRCQTLVGSLGSLHFCLTWSQT